MISNTSHQKVVKHLEQIEEIGELVVAKQEQIVHCDKSRQHTREALRALTHSEKGKSKQWVLLSDQFFQFPQENLVRALKCDMKTYDDEITKLREGVKEDIKVLNDLEGTDSLKGFDLIALSSGIPQS